MHSLRAKLIAAFIIATLMPLCATIWITTSLLERSLGYATTGELDRLSRTLEGTVRQFYQRERDSLKREALDGRRRCQRRMPSRAFGLARAGSRVLGERRSRSASSLSGPAAIIWTSCAGSGAASTSIGRDLGGIRMQDLSRSSAARARARRRDSRHAICDAASRSRCCCCFALVWIVSLAPILFIAHRVSKPDPATHRRPHRFRRGPMGSSSSRRPRR